MPSWVSSFFFSSRRRHTRCYRDWSSDVCSSDLSRGPRYEGAGCGLGSSECSGGSCTDRKSTRLNSSHGSISYAVFCLKKNPRLHLSPLHACTYSVRARRRTACERASLARHGTRALARGTIGCPPLRRLIFFFNDTATTEIYTLSLHDALPISRTAAGAMGSLPALVLGAADKS